MKIKIVRNSYAAGFISVLLYSAWTSYQFLAFSTTDDKTMAVQHAMTFMPLADDKVKDIILSDHNQFVSKEVWPSWKNGTIQMQPMLDFVNRLLLDPRRTYTETREREYWQKWDLVETLYAVSTSGVYGSTTLKALNKEYRQLHRMMPIEGLMNEAIQLLVSTPEEDRKTKWAHLDELMIQQGHSFPVLIHFGDHNSCDYHNYRDQKKVLHSLPLFTFGTKSNKLDCWNGFPIPSYNMIRESKKSSDEWDIVFAERDRRYPRHEKIPQAVWRGSLSDGSIIVNGETPRIKLVTLTNHGYGKTSSLFNVGFSSNKHFRHIKMTSLKHLVKGTMPFSDVQKFAAVIDIDGNAWSSRFPTQLCLNSVTLKVEPRYMEYFIGSEVKPGVHYIPIQEDLSDLLEQTQWVLHHPEESQQIVANTQKWCREHMIWKSLARDLLDIWEKYITWLNEHDPEWYGMWEAQWSTWNQTDSVFRPYENTQELSQETLAGYFPNP